MRTSEPLQETGEVGEDGPEEGTGLPNWQTLRTVAVLEVFAAGAVEDVAWLGATGSFVPIWFTMLGHSRLQCPNS